jgi:hypothetical protein
MNTNDLTYNQMHMNTLLREARERRLARLATADYNTSSLRARVFRPLGRGLVSLGQTLLDASASPSERIIYWAS